MSREMKESSVSWIGKIPTSWEIHRMKSCIEDRTSGAWGNEQTGGDGDIICLRIADFDYSKFRFNDCSKEEFTIRNYDKTTIERLKLRKGDILIEKSGGGEKTPVGRTVIFDKDYPALYANFMDRLRCSDFVTSQWMQYLLVVFYKNDYSRNYIKQTTGIQNIDLTSMLANEKVPIPSLLEQNRITSFLNTQCAHIYSVVEKTRAAVEEYKKLKQAVITQAVTKGIRPNREMRDSGIEWIGEIPEEWDTLFAFQVFEQVKNKNTGLIESNLLSLSYGKIIRKSIDTTFGLLPESFEGYNIINEDDIVLRLTDLQNDHKSLRVGITKQKGIITSAYLTLRNNSKSCPDYLYYYLHSFDVAKGFYGMGAGVRQGLNWNELKHLIILCPPENEQTEIVSFLKCKIPEIDSLISKKEQLITELEAYKKSLIYEYVTGKKEVKVDITVEYSPEFKKALLMCRILELTQCKGRIHLQKTFFALDTLLNLFSTQYYRFEHGPYDLNIERYERIIEEKGWLNIYVGKSIRYNKTNTFSDYFREYEKVFGDRDDIIQRICKVFNVPRTTKAEKIATLLAVWNDFLINGIEPTDDMIIDDVITNWTPNKANVSRETWSEFISKIRENNIAPKGYGKHTKRMEELVNGKKL